MPIDEWCATAAAALWGDNAAARAAERDFAALRRWTDSLLLDAAHRSKVCDKAYSALGAWLADRSERGEIQLWGRPGGRIEDPKLIPSSAVRVLEFDYDKRTASGEGLPLLYDVRVQQAATGSASAQWAADTTRRLLASPAPPKHVSEADLRRAVKAIVENHPPGSPPLNEESLCDEVERRLGVQLARDRVLAARNEVAPHFKLRVGRPRKNAQ